jgi:alpha-amylase
MVHAFDMKWSAIAERIPLWAELGYDAVLVPPIFPHWRDPEGHWWAVYQPTRTDRVGATQSGSVDEFRAMLAVARQHRVRIVGDLVLNHRVGVDCGTDTTGEKFCKGRYPDGARARDFHRDDATVLGPIGDWRNRKWIQRGALLGLEDLATDEPRVQLRQAVGVALAALEGVQDFRIDAAKHMPKEDIATIFELAERLVRAVAAGRDPAAEAPRVDDVEALVAPLRAPLNLEALRARLSRTERALWLYQEVIDFGNEVVTAREYLDNGPVTEMRFGALLARHVRAHDFTGIEGELDALLPSARAVVTVSNHDDQRGHGGSHDVLTFQDGAAYTLAHALLLGLGYGTPLVISSFTFDDTEAGRPADSKRFVDEDLDPAIAPLVKFRSAVLNERRVVVDSDGGVLAFARGTRGFVVINGTESVIRRTFQTQLPLGSYSDPLTPNAAPILVDAAGRASIEVGPMHARAFHVDASSH